ncbi:hypothetical protein LS684_14110 [Cytobacillus spongiae]|uniref:hypothetical protein n=1 Tax=Cytobacillus spongiae TaxID=2901381 RepID=UPI001F32E1B5|nr:hypothetical protein [Cytobacillus spongiae]UII54790.1 hypothetical protein LS684_14110 [Cytobacillus spongiae]
MGCNRDRNNVAGAFDDRDDLVAGAFDENFRVPVKAFIDGEDFCRGVRRCLIKDLVAGARDDRRDRRRHRRCW